MSVISLPQWFVCRTQPKFSNRLLLRYLSYLSNWSHSFTRLFTILRAVLWQKLDLLGLLGCYGTAKGSFRNLALPEQAYFPGFV
jgi:hypothetical protein